MPNRNHIKNPTEGQCSPGEVAHDEIPLGIKTAALSAPALLTAEHQVAQFHCRQTTLTTWLQQRALPSQQGGAKTYVVCAENAVVGFYSLAAGAINRQAAPTAALRKNMPDPMPIIVLARLAVHTEWEGRGIGAGLLKNALLRAIQASEIIGARLLVGHAIDEDAQQFYLRHGFREAPLDSALTVVAPLR